MNGLRLRYLVIAVVIVAAPGAAAAQDSTSGTITGVVRDASGGVLPGVTVEAASPALIEKVRVATTDTDGRFRIIDLRPGMYSVTFTLTGFRTVRREGVELTTGFTATVNADLPVGAVEETITVSGVAPVVDVTGAAQQQVFSGETVRTLPVGKNAGIYAALIPGAMQNSLADQDVGGTKGENTQRFVVHGGRQNDAFQLRDGMYFGSHIGVGGNYNSSVNPATVEEVQVQTTGGLTAEAQSGGVQINVISRDGGNEFHGTLLTDFGHRQLQGNNLNDDLRRRGAAVPAFIRQLYDVAGGVGGPLRRDRVWFFASARKWVSSSYVPGNYYNGSPNPLFYVPDLNRPAYDRTLAQEGGVRVTIQPSQKHKFTATSRWEYNCNCNFQVAAGTHAPEVAGSDWYPPMRITQGTWTYTATNRLLVQVSAIELGGVLERRLADGTPQSVSEEIAVFNALTNYWSGGADRALMFTQNAHSRQDYGQRNVTGSVSYVTGSHNFKVGGLFLKSSRDLTTDISNGLAYTFAGTMPQSVTYFATPIVARARTTQTALYAQEQWTMRRLTLNLGLRYEGQVGYVPPTEMPAGRFVPARSFGEVKNVPNWKDINPRLGFAIDLFGTGRTAVKGSLGRFVIYEANGGLVFNANPSNTLVTSATRTWNDANGNYVPEASELGPLSNDNFGTSVAPNTVYSDEVLRGWGNRGYNWQGSLAAQHELGQGVGLSVGYFRTWYGNFLVTDNVLVSPSDFDSYCIARPSNTRLPDSGEQICGLVDLKPQAFGRVSNVVNLNSHYGDQRDIYNGVDVTLNARFGNGGLVTGGFSTGHVETDACDVVEKVPEFAINMAANAALTTNHVNGPNSAPSRFCRIEQAWGALTQLKLSGAYTLPWDITASINYQNIAGLPTTAQYVVSGAEMTAGLGRTPSAGARATAIVELIEPQTLFREKRLNQVNLAFTRVLRFGGSRVQPRIEIANAFNANTVTQMTTRYGPAWETVRGYLPPRLVKFGAQWNF